jgi:hypothetical protein
MDAYLTQSSATPNSLIPAKNSLFLEIFSLLICVGNYAKSDCGAAVSCYEIGPGSPEIAKFPVKFPVSRELPVETGSYLTAHTTILVHPASFLPSRKSRARPFRCGIECVALRGILAVSSIVPS